MGVASERLIFALDVPDLRTANTWFAKLTDHVGAFKIGLELFISVGPSVVYIGNAPIMLDLKLHDIPETVERAVGQVGDLGVKFLTLHVQQRETMRRAVKMAEKTGLQLLGVTVLTSMTEADLADMRYADLDPSRRAVDLARMGWEEGLTGFVTSPKEVALIRAELPKSILVIPGIRPAGSELGDQKRVGTPAQAVADGADYLVVGRPIRDAADPVAAADAIAAEITGAGRMP
jgi:orotidine-5'-phosphate decarboxylase